MMMMMLMMMIGSKNRTQCDFVSKYFVAETFSGVERRRIRR